MVYRTAISTLLLLLSFHAKAALINTATSSIDDVSNLEWLHLDLTKDMSYNTVVSQLSTNPLFNGYRIAALSEIQTLDFNPPDILHNDWANGFNLDFMYGAPTGSSVDAGRIELIVDPEFFIFDYFFYESHTTYLVDDAHFSIATALVRDYTPSAVPVPAAIWLFTSGLIGLLAFSRRNVK